MAGMARRLSFDGDRMVNKAPMIHWRLTLVTVAEYAKSWEIRIADFDLTRTKKPYVERPSIVEPIEACRY
jgi:hypothetical protein